MTPAFIAPFPTLSARPARRRAAARRPPLVATSSSETPSPSEIPSPSEPPALPSRFPPLPKKLPLLPPRLPPTTELQDTPLTAALYALMQGTQTPQDALTSVLAPDATWSTPLFDASSREEIVSTISTFLSFAIDPTLAIYQLDVTACRFAWTLSFNHPLPWRPRIAIAGSTVFSVDSSDGRVRSVKDEWAVSILGLLRQTIPTLADAMWLWPTPQAETDIGLRTTLKRARGYNLVRVAPRTEVRVRGKVLDVERKFVFSAMAIPEQAYEGSLRRLEQYSTVSPVSVRELDDDGEVEWVMNAPGLHVGSANTLLPTPRAECVNVEVAEKRVFAVARFSGFATRDVVARKMSELSSRLRDDGLWEGELGWTDIWVRSYDTKVGFNSTGQIAIAGFASTMGLPRISELAVDVTSRVTDIN